MRLCLCSCLLFRLCGLLACSRGRRCRACRSLLRCDPLRCGLLYALIAHDHARIRLSLRHFEPGAGIQIRLRDRLADHIGRSKAARQPLVLAELCKKVFDELSSLRVAKKHDRLSCSMAVIKIPPERFPDIIHSDRQVLLLRSFILQRICAERRLPEIRRVDRRVVPENSFLHIEGLHEPQRVLQARHVFTVRVPAVHIDGRQDHEDIRFSSLRRRIVRLRHPLVRPAVVGRPDVPLHVILIDFMDLPVVTVVVSPHHAQHDLRAAVAADQQFLLYFVKRQPLDLPRHSHVVQRALKRHRRGRAVRVHAPAVNVIWLAHVRRAVIRCHVEIAVVIGNALQPLRRRLEVDLADVLARLEAVTVQIAAALIADP